MSAPLPPPLYPSVTFWLKLKCGHDGWTCCLLNNRLLCFSCWSSSSCPSPPALPCARKVSAHDYQPKCPMPSSDQWTHFSQSPRYLWYPVTLSHCYSLLEPVKLTFERPYRHITALQCDCEWGASEGSLHVVELVIPIALLGHLCSGGAILQEITHFSHGTLNTVNKLWIINK